MKTPHALSIILAALLGLAVPARAQDHDCDVSAETVAQILTEIKIAPRSKKRLALTPGTMTAADAEVLVDVSEGRDLENSRRSIKGHSRDHIPARGEDPYVVVEARVRNQAAENRAGTRAKVAPVTTVYRRGDQAYEDIADISNRLKAELDALPPGTDLTNGTALTKRIRLRSSRTGLDARSTRVPGLPDHAVLKKQHTFCEQLAGGNSCWKVSTVSFDVVDIAYTRLPNGELHLIQFTPVVNPDRPYNGLGIIPIMELQ